LGFLWGMMQHGCDVIETNLILASDHAKAPVYGNDLGVCQQRAIDYISEDPCVGLLSTKGKG
jgi:hypothetical protein